MIKPKTQLLALLLLASAASGAAAEWQLIEKIVTYSVRGRSGIELYQDIGHRGPVVGKGIRAIAHTNFKLTWRRNYVNEGTACVLRTAVPKLIITTTLPKPAEPLPSPTRENWKIFIDGIAAHEKVHAVQIEKLARDIETATVGLTVPDDPGCRKIRAVMTERLGALSRAQQAASNEFDRVEMGPGGAIPKLVLDLVNGDLQR
jgi:predicted secreted Zn-dependent protease